MNPASRNVAILAFSQAMAMSGASLMVATAALVGLELAQDKSLSTMPIAVQYIAVMLTTIPAAMFMSRFGRKAGFLLAMFFGLSGAAIATYCIIEKQFMGFVLGVALIGMLNGFANYYRFAAADAVDMPHKSRAISFVLAGGVLAAIIGPNLANYSRGFFHDANFAGSYASLIFLYILSFIVLSFLRLPQPVAETKEEQSVRSLKAICRQPAWGVAVVCGMLGYGVMSFVMTATPLAMKHHAHGFPDTSFVIQWHVLAMFAPSFVTGKLIQKWGELKILSVGALLGIACVLINLLGTSVSHFWFALVLLGVSWNFLFVASTSLLTHTYHPAERFKVQALNDFIIFSTVAVASLSAGYLQHHFGWRVVNLGVLPLLIIIIFSVIYLKLLIKKEKVLIPALVS